MTYVVRISKFFTELIRASNDRLDALTDGVPVGEKNDDDKACIG